MYRMIAVTPSMRYRVYTTPDGIRRTYVGPEFATPRAAGAYLETLDSMPVVSPLRDQRPPPDLLGKAPAEPGGLVSPSPERSPRA